MSGRLSDFLNPDSLAALSNITPVAPKPPPKKQPAGITPGPGMALVELELPDVEPIFGSDCPKCRYVLYLRVVLWPPGVKPKDAPSEAWWCGRCERYYVYREIGDAEEERGDARTQLPQVQLPHKGNGDVQRVRQGGLRGAV